MSITIAGRFLSDEMLTEAFAVGFEVARENDCLPERQRTYEADVAVAKYLGIPVHLISQVFRPARVRQETNFERMFRRRDQVPVLPRTNVYQWIRWREARGHTINRDLVPGRPVFIKDPTYH